MRTALPPLQLSVTTPEQGASAYVYLSSPVSDDRPREGNLMRNTLMAGTAGLLIVLGAAGAANAANPNVPTYSPYTLMYVPGSVPYIERTGKPVMAADQVEGRAA